jgi:hypothetical protein
VAAAAVAPLQGFQLQLAVLAVVLKTKAELARALLAPVGKATPVAMLLVVVEHLIMVLVAVAVLALSAVTEQLRQVAMAELALLHQLLVQVLRELVAVALQPLPAEPLERVPREAEMAKPTAEQLHRPLQIPAAVVEVLVDLQLQPEAPAVPVSLSSKYPITMLLNSPVVLLLL